MTIRSAILAALLLGLSSTAAAQYTQTAFWTGRSEFVQTVTYQQGINCEYNYAGRTFWRTFVGAVCPNSVQVQ